MDDMICLPRSVVAALVEVAGTVFLFMGEDWAEAVCSNCAATVGQIGDIGYRNVLDATHDTSCPVRLAQEALTADAPAPPAHP